MTSDELVKYLEERPDEVSRAISDSYKHDGGSRAYRFGYDRALSGVKYRSWFGSDNNKLLYMLGYLDGYSDRLNGY